MPVNHTSFSFFFILLVHMAFGVHIKLACHLASIALTIALNCGLVEDLEHFELCVHYASP